LGLVEFVQRDRGLERRVLEDEVSNLLEFPGEKT